MLHFWIIYFPFVRVWARAYLTFPDVVYVHVFYLPILYRLSNSRLKCVKGYSKYQLFVDFVIFTRSIFTASALHKSIKTQYLNSNETCPTTLVVRFDYFILMHFYCNASVS